MSLAQAALEDLDGAVIALLREVELALRRRQAGKRIEAVRHIRMIGAEHPFANGESAQDDLLGLVVAPFELIDDAEIVQRIGKAGMIDAERLFALCDDLLHLRLGGVEVALRPGNAREARQRIDAQRIVLRQLRADRLSPQEKRFRVTEALALDEGARNVVEADDEIGRSEERR